ncbi:MAG: AAA family ATPase [Chloroflexota bacterium]
MCVGGDTKIFTNPHGLVKAKHLFDNAQGECVRDDHIKIVKLKKPVKTYAFSDDRLEEAAITHVAQLTVPAYKVTLGDGNELVCSHNQPFLVFEDGGYAWKLLKELRSGMFIARVNKLALPHFAQKLKTPALLVEKAGKFAPISRNLSRSNWIKLPQKTSAALWEYIGLLVAEGYIAEDSVTFCNTSPELREHYLNLLEELFGIHKATIYTEDRAGGRVVVYSKALVAYLAQFNLTPGKKWPTVLSLLYHVPREEVAAFIRGYLAGDGTVSFAGGYPTPKLFSATKAFLHDLQAVLLLKLSIDSTVRGLPTQKGMMYELAVLGNQGRMVFAKHIGAITEEKRKRLEQIDQSNREHSHVPVPGLLLETLRSCVPYQAYRGHDKYVYGRGLFTKHALTRLYDIVRTHGALTPAIEAEYMQLMRDDIGWEQIVDITPLGTQELYDFTVDKDSFVAAPYFLLHNSKYYGEAEGNLRDVFDEAKKRAPAIIFIDEIDAIAPKREEMSGDRQVERRVVAQLLALMDGLESRGNVIVIAATNIPNTLDPALRRPGRFDREIAISVPDKDGRREILEIHTRGMPLAEDVDLERLAAITHGFVGADLEALCREAAMSALRRLMPDIDFAQARIPYDKLMALEVTSSDFLTALAEVEPSAIREVFTEVPEVGWDDIGGLEEVKRLLMETVEWPLQHRDLFGHARTTPPKGILLHGPPGTGKTLLAKAVAKESGVNFIAVKGPQLLTMWVGESERAVREVFKKAKQTSPCIVFFDELDALTPRRGAGADSHVTERVVSQFLAEMDGIEELKGVVVLGATNRLDIVDPALLRPGRFEVLLELPMPDREARLAIFRVHTRGKPLASDVDLTELAERTEGMMGADIEGLCRQAAMAAIREFLENDRRPPTADRVPEFRIARRHFEKGFAGRQRQE